MATYWENSCSFGLRYVSWYKCLIVSLVFSHLGFWSGNLFLIAPFPDLCLLVPFDTEDEYHFVINIFILLAVPRRYFCCRSNCFMFRCLICVLFAPLMYVLIYLDKPE